MLNNYMQELVTNHLAERTRILETQKSLRSWILVKNAGVIQLLYLVLAITKHSG